MSKDDLIGSVQIEINPDSCGLLSLPSWHAIRKKQKISGDLQMQIECTHNTNAIVSREYTHILQFTVQDIEMVPNDQQALWLNDKSYECNVEWGDRSFVTSLEPLNNEKKVRWNQSFYVFVDCDKQKQYELKISIIGNTFPANSHFGSAYIAAKQIFDTKDGEAYNACVDLFKGQAKFDKDLSMVSSNNSEVLSICGKLNIAAKLISRQNIEGNFYQKLCDKYDFNKDSQLTGNEISQILSTLKININVEEFMLRFDSDFDGILSEKDLLEMLTDYQFQDSDDSNRVE